MPIQMVCDSTPSLVSAALRDTLHSAASTNGRLSGVAGTANGGSTISTGTGLSSQSSKQQMRRHAGDSDEHEYDEEEDDALMEQLSQSLSSGGKTTKRITYEEGPCYNTSLDLLKSKYIVLDGSNGSQHSANSNGSNGVGSSGAGGAPMNTSKASTGLSSSSMSLNSSTKCSSNAAQSMHGGKLMTTTSLHNGVTSASTASPASSASKKDTATLPTPKRTLFPRENVQIGWKTTGRKWHVGAGMINMGNTCYLNSTLQALFHVPAIANWLLADVQHRERCDDGGSGGSCIICAMAKTLIESQSNQSAIRPHLVNSKLRLVCKHLVPGRQEDAHEFLRYLVEAMEKSYLGRFKNSKELDQYSKETTPLNQILGGYLRSEVKCPACYHISTTFQHFEDLLLDIRKANSIDEGLELYFARERLEENGYKCEACKRRVAATKQFSLERAPFVLCIQLKRFSVMGGKINKHVELRPRLDLTPYSSPALKGGSNGKLLYRLTSMVTHLGSTQHCGHYTAIGHTDAGAYHVFDDSSVRPIGMHNLTTTNAYILFYELESPVGSAGLPNGVCRTKPSATVGQPSSTATLTSMGHLNSDGGGGSSGTPGKGTTTNSSPLRVVGTGGSGVFPSKLEQKSTFIGPVLPTTASSTSSQPNTAITATSNGSVTTAGQQGNSSSLVSSSQKSDASGTKYTVDASFSSPSSTASTLSNASPLASPVKGMQPQSSHALTSGSGQPNSKTPKLTSSNGPSNGGLKEEKKLSTSAPLLPSMPKLVSSANKMNSPLVNAPTQPSVVSLVPYETDDSNSSDDDDDDDDGSDKRTAVPIMNGGPKRPKQTPAAGGVHQNGLKPTKMVKAAVFERSEGNDENDDEHRRADAVDERQEMAASRSPQLVKTKRGLWKVSSSSTADQLSFPDSGSSGGSAPSSKASSPATSVGSSPSSSPAGSHQQKQQSQQRNGVDASKSTALTNGHRNNGSNQHQPTFNGAVGDKRKPMAVNGYHQGIVNGNQSNGGGGGGGGGGGKTRPTNGDLTASSGGAAVQVLLKLSHRGYGAPVKSWDGQETAMDRELATERREERKRQIEDDRETEMDRGRVKKSKGNAAPNGSFGCGGNGSNPFQSYQNGGKWNGNRNGGNNHYNNYHRGGGSYYSNGNGQRYHHGGSSSNNGFRNNGRRFGGRNGGAGGGGNFHSKGYHHHQRSESSGGGGGMASGSGNNGSNGFYHR